MNSVSKTLQSYRFFDRADLEIRFRGSSVGDIVQIYLDESPPMIREFIKAGRPPMDPKSMSQWAHSLKGSLDMLCATQLGELAGEIQDCYRDERSETLSDIFDELVIGLRGLRLELEAYRAECD